MSESKDRSLIQKARDRLSAVKATIVEQPQVTFPALEDLPKVDGQPQGCLWGFFDKDGTRDEVGTLNLLTPAVVREAAREVRTGEHVQLDACLSDHVEFPGFGRKKFEQRVIDARPGSKGKHAGFDDELSFNTQSGSQWDSFKHFAHQKTQMYYNDLSHDDALNSHANGIHKWCERGGIVGRGVLVDWLSWYEEHHGTPPSPVTRHEIPVSELDECLRWQGTTTKMGDILLIRSGYQRWHNNASSGERKRGTQESALAIGVQQNEVTVHWLYDHHFAAVAGDTIAFEAWPPPFKRGPVLHEWLLVQWGTPIGELWDLERLSKVCEKEKRWTFFLTSAPLHVKGGVGSPPGAIAVF